MPAKVAIAQPLEIGVCGDSKFTTGVPDIFSKYKLPNVSSNHIGDLWNSHPMGVLSKPPEFRRLVCYNGVRSLSHLSDVTTTEPLVRSIYIFHAYFQVWQILTELRAALPEDATFNTYENSYDRKAYERIYSEFRVGPYRGVFQNIVVLCPSTRFNKEYLSRGWMWSKEEMIYSINPREHLQWWLGCF